MTLDTLKGMLGDVAVPAPEARLAAFVKNAQVNQLDALLASGETVEALARRLELGSSPQTEDDLRKIPLINPKLANL